MIYFPKDISRLKINLESPDKSFKPWKNISRRILKILRKTQEVIWDTRIPNKIFGTHEKEF
jgi:hypothetical protein